MKEEDGISQAEVWVDLRARSPIVWPQTFLFLEIADKLDRAVSKSPSIVWAPLDLYGR